MYSRLAHGVGARARARLVHVLIHVLVFVCVFSCVRVRVRLGQQLPTSVHVLSKDPVLGDNVMSLEHVGAEKDMDTMLVRQGIMEVLHDLSEDERTIVTLR